MTNEVSAQDLINILTEQRNAAMNAAAQFGAMVEAERRRIKELEKRIDDWTDKKGDA